MEWVIGLVDPNVNVLGETDVVAAIVVEPGSKLVLAAKVGSRADLTALVEDAVDVATAATLGRRRAPAIRTADPEVALALGVLGVTGVTHAPTPELGDVVRALRARLAQSVAEDEDGGEADDGDEGGDDDEDPDLADDVRPEDLASLFTAAARFWRATPWREFPPDELVSVDCPALGLTNALACVVGQEGESYGFAVYADQATFDAVELMDEDPSRVPPQIMLMFDAEEDLAPEVVDEVREFGWEIAEPRAYPRVLRIGEGGARVPATAADQRGIAAIAQGLAQLAERGELEGRWERRAPTELRTGEVVIAVPQRLAQTVKHAPVEPAVAKLETISLFDEDSEEVHTEAAEAYVEAVVAAFERSREARGVDSMWAALFIGHAARDAGYTLGHLSPTLIRDVVLYLIPRNAVCDPGDAPAIVAATRAVLAFAARELGGFGPNRAMTALPDDAADTLAEALGDPDVWGMAKRVMMEGRAAGFAVDTQEGLEAWIEVVNSRAAPAGAKPKAKAKAAKPAAKKPAAKKPAAKKPAAKKLVAKKPAAKTAKKPAAKKKR